MALGPGDLVLCSGSLAREATFRERVAAAVAGGFAGLSLWGRDYFRAQGSGLSDADLRTLLADSGIAVAELDLAWSWLPGASDIHIPAELDTEELFAYDEADLFRIGDAVGARSINAIDVFGGAWSVDDAAAAFAGLCDRAAEHGLLVHIEFLPWSRIPDAAVPIRRRCAPFPATGCSDSNSTTGPPKQSPICRPRHCTSASYPGRASSISARS